MGVAVILNQIAQDRASRPLRIKHDGTIDECEAFDIEREIHARTGRALRVDRAHDVRDGVVRILVGERT